MSQDRIESDTLIAAPLDRVWSVVAVPGFWVDDSNPEAKEGDVVLAKNEQHGNFPVRVVKVDAPTSVSYRWAPAFPGQELTDDNSTLAEFTLTEEGDGTRLRVVETGFASLAASEELRTKAFNDNSGGWPHVIAAVKNRAEEG